MDIGCGKGDLLVRLAHRGLTGEGLDRNRWFLADAARLAAAAGVAERLTWTLTPDAPLAVVPRGDVVACVGAGAALGEPADVPRRVREALDVGGLALLGEGFWSRPPEPAWMAEFGIAPGEMEDLAGTVARVAAAGFEPLATLVASTAGWDAYEAAYADGLAGAAASMPDADPDRALLVERAAFMRDTYARWRRDAMGFVLVAARAVTADPG